MTSKDGEENLPPLEEAVPAEEPVTPPEVEIPEEAIVDQFSEIADSIRVNSWFHIQPDGTTDKQKIKLAAIIKHNGTYIFVNQGRR